MKLPVVMNYTSTEFASEMQNGRVGMAVVPLALILNVDPCLGRLFCLQRFRNCYLRGRAECHSLLLTPFNLHSTTQLEHSACPGERRESKKLHARTLSKELIWILKFCQVATDTHSSHWNLCLKLKGFSKSFVLPFSACMVQFSVCTGEVGIAAGETGVYELWTKFVHPWRALAWQLFSLPCILSKLLP